MGGDDFVRGHLRGGCDFPGRVRGQLAALRALHHHQLSRNHVSGVCCCFGWGGRGDGVRWWGAYFVHSRGRESVDPRAPTSRELLLVVVVVVVMVVVVVVVAIVTVNVRSIGVVDVSALLVMRSQSREKRRNLPSSNLIIVRYRRKTQAPTPRRGKPRQTSKNWPGSYSQARRSKHNLPCPPPPSPPKHRHRHHGNPC